MTRGSCLCGTVRWEFDGTPGEMSHCHCTMCRKAHGAPFATYLSVPAAAFRTTAGDAAVRLYESSPGFHRAFCGGCGSVTPFPVAGGSRYAVPAGGLDDDAGVRPARHIFFASKAPWHRVADDLPKDAAYPEGGPAEIARPDRAGGKPGVLKGSCLCGGVEFEVEEPFVAAHNCHCSRCRKARAAAHTTNGFVPVDRFRFTRGADQVDRYKIPEAVSFTQAFCRTCGSGLPRIREDAGVAIFPLAPLDDVPAQGADDHIFVASKAAWYELPEDGLPRFTEGAG